MIKAILFAVPLALGSLAVPPAAAEQGARHAAEQRLQTNRDHHQGRSFAQRRGDLRTPSYLRRAARARALTASTRKP